MSLEQDWFDVKDVPGPTQWTAREPRVSALQNLFTNNIPRRTCSKGGATSVLHRPTSRKRNLV